LRSAIVAYRHSLSQREAAAVPVDANSSNVTNSTAPGGTNGGPISPMRLVPLTRIHRDQPGLALVNPNQSYPLLRARSAVAAAEDFAAMVAALLQAYGVHSRIAVLCTSSQLHSSSADTAAPATAEVDVFSASCRTRGSLMAVACQLSGHTVCAAKHPSRSCRTVVEARLGKSPRKLAAWIAQHRRAMRSSGRSIKGAKVLWYRQDSQGFIWLPLTYQLSSTEQLPGAPYPNFTHAIHYPLPLFPATNVICSIDATGLDTAIDDRGQLCSAGGKLSSVLSVM